MKTSNIEAYDVRQFAAGRWTDILGAIAPALTPALSRLGRHVPCPVHGGTDGFRLFRDVDETGGGVCNTCGTFHDGFALLMWVNRWYFPDALRAVAHELGMMADRVSEPRRVGTPSPRPKERDRESVIEALNRVWQQALDPADRRAAPLRAYLANRGLSGVKLDGEVVRFHPALGYWQSNSGNEPELVGGSIRLFAAGPTLGVAEGIETALAVHLRTGMPVWSALSAGLLARLEPPAETSLVVVWADRDRSGAGEEAAMTLRERLQRQGISVAMHLPPGPIPARAKGIDWADVWCNRTERAVA